MIIVSENMKLTLSLHEFLDPLAKAYIKDVIASCDGDVGKAGQVLQMSQASVYRRLASVRSVAKSHTPEYRAWNNMHDRCYNPESQCFKYYGGRGITVSARWSEFEAFFADMGPKPNRKYSLDRINVNGNYVPDNCRWANSTTQQNNRRCNIVIEYKGKTKTLAEWCKVLGVNSASAWHRLKNGKPLDIVFTPPAA